MGAVSFAGGSYSVYVQNSVQGSLQTISPRAKYGDFDQQHTRQLALKTFCFRVLGP